MDLAPYLSTIRAPVVQTLHRGDCEDCKPGASTATQVQSQVAFQQDRVDLSAAAQEALAREESEPGQGDSAELPPDGNPAAIADGNVAEESGSDGTAAGGQGDGTDDDSTAGPGETDVSGQPLTDAEIQQVDELRARDQEVRTHEQAHLAAAGGLAMGGPTYSYQSGPDGRRYAVGGEVQIDTAPVPGDPQATIQKMAQVRRAALAPAEPSSTDRAVAAQASRTAAEARSEAIAEESGTGPESSRDSGSATGSESASQGDEAEATNAARAADTSDDGGSAGQEPASDPADLLRLNQIQDALGQGGPAAFGLSA